MTREFWRVGFEQGLRNPLVSPEEAAAHPYTRIGACAHRSAAPQVAASAPREQVASRLRELAQRLELHEIVINTWTYDPAARRRSYELLAAEFGLAPAAHCSSPATSSDRLPTATR